jgi:hypothetical protein
MLQYEEYLRVQKPGIAGFSGTRLRCPAIDAKGNVGTVTTTVESDVESGDPDDVEQEIATTDIVNVSESFKSADGRHVSKPKEVKGVFQAAALGHPGAAAKVAAIVKRRDDERAAIAEKGDAMNAAAAAEMVREAAELAALEAATAPKS